MFCSLFNRIKTTYYFIIRINKIHQVKLTSDKNFTLSWFEMKILVDKYFSSSNVPHYIMEIISLVYRRVQLFGIR